VTKVNGDKTRISAQVLAEAGVMVALAALLSYITFFQAPYGGRVTAGGMVPILILALRRGPVAGILGGMALGLIYPFIEPPFIAHWAQAALDYPVAFGLLGLAGFVRRSPLAGATLGIAGRFVSHVLSGVVFFAEYAPEGVHPLTYSMLYNGGYLLPELLISGLVIYLLLRTRRTLLLGENT